MHFTRVVSRWFSTSFGISCFTLEILAEFLSAAERGRRGRERENNNSDELVIQKLLLLWLGGSRKKIRPVTVFYFCSGKFKHSSASSTDSPAAPRGSPGHFNFFHFRSRSHDKHLSSSKIRGRARFRLAGRGTSIREVSRRRSMQIFIATRLPCVERGLFRNYPRTSVPNLYARNIPRQKTSQLFPLLDRAKLELEECCETIYTETSFSVSALTSEATRTRWLHCDIQVTHVTLRSVDTKIPRQYGLH